MRPWVTGQIVTGEMVCDGCSRIMRHPERYGHICEEEKPPLRFCEDCSRAKGYLEWNEDKKMDTFLTKESDDSGGLS